MWTRSWWLRPVSGRSSSRVAAGSRREHPPVGLRRLAARVADHLRGRFGQSQISGRSMRPASPSTWPGDAGDIGLRSWRRSNCQPRWRWARRVRAKSITPEVSPSSRWTSSASGKAARTRASRQSAGPGGFAGTLRRPEGLSRRGDARRHAARECPAAAGRHDSGQVAGYGMGLYHMFDHCLFRGRRTMYKKHPRADQSGPRRRRRSHRRRRSPACGCGRTHYRPDGGGTAAGYISTTSATMHRVEQVGDDREAEQLLQESGVAARRCSARAVQPRRSSRWRRRSGRTRSSSGRTDRISAPFSSARRRHGSFAMPNAR